MTHRLAIGLMAAALVLGGCAREEGSGTETTTGQGPTPETLTLDERTVRVPVDTIWMNSGIVLRMGERIELTARTDTGNPTAGSPIADDSAPLPTYGSDGLIGRIGENGFPFAINGEFDLQGSSLTAGEPLFLGRNTAPPQPFLSEITTDAPGAATAQTLAAEEIVIDYDPEPYEVDVRIRISDAPALLTPIDTFFESDGNPIFDWDEIDNASQYNLDISSFPDFRSVIFSINVGTTSINTATLTVDPTNPTAPVTPNLSEGLYYWRVRAQVNAGRILNPNLTWTERSIPFRLGVETEAQLPAPRLLTPDGPVVVNIGSVVPFEVLATPDASGLQWRYRFFDGSCGEVIDPSGSAIARLGSPWMVFQQTFQSNRIEEPQKMYGAFVSPVLEEGEWLLRVETRDGLDNSGDRIGVLDYEFTAGCQ